MSSYPLTYGVVLSLLQKLNRYEYRYFFNSIDNNVLRQNLLSSTDIERFSPESNVFLTALAVISKVVEIPDLCVNENIQDTLYEIHDVLDEDNSYGFNKRINNPMELISDGVQTLKDDSLLAGQLGLSRQLSLLSSSTLTPTKLVGPDVELPPHLVPCFAYCSLYPKGHRLVREFLVNQWMAQGYLSQPSTVPDDEAKQQLEDIGDRYFNELLSLGLFQDPTFALGGYISNNTVTGSSNQLQPTQTSARVYSCEMHPLAHAAARQIAQKEVAIIPTSHNHLTAVPQHIRYIAVESEHLSIGEFTGVWEEAGEMVRRCLFFGSSTGPLEESFLRIINLNFSCLRVLDLSGSQFKNLPDFSPSIHKHLRYLGLSRNELFERFEFQFSSFTCLQTVAVDGCIQLQEFPLSPQPSLSYRIRHLYLTSKQKTLDLSPFICLQILELSHCTELSSLSISRDNRDLNLRSLRKLRIFRCPRLIHLPKGMLSDSPIEELVFHDCARLFWTNSKAMENLPRLRYLELIGLPKLEELPVGLQSATSLEHFMVANCIRLERLLTDGMQYLQSLQKFYIENCPKLLALPEGIRYLANLQSLHITKCPNLIQRCALDGEDQPLISHVPEVILEQQCLLNQDNQKPSSSQHRVDDATSVPYFTLKSQTFASAGYSAEMLDQGNDPSISSGWGDYEFYLHCCLFPGDYEFERDTLVQLWMAAGFLKDANMEDAGNIYFEILLSEKYILFSRIDYLTGQKKYKMNLDKVTAMSFERPTFEEGEIKTADGSEKSCHVSVVDNHINQSTFETLMSISELKTLLFIRDYGSLIRQIPSNFFIALRSLQALDLSGSHITELPSSIANARQLCYLDLSFTLIERLPESIECLQELQTLKLKECKHLFALPKGMKELIRLRHLDFDVLGQLTSMPKGIGQLTELRTLSAFIVDIDEEGCNLRELKNMNNLCGSCCISGLENATSIYNTKAALKDKCRLTQLQLRWGYCEREGKSQYLVEDLKPNFCLEEVQIVGYPGSKLPSWIADAQFEKLASITLVKCENTRLKETLGHLPNLKYLGITQMDRVTTIDYFFTRSYEHWYPTSAFPNLKNLAIDGMNSLETWTGVVWGDFALLSELSIKNCPKLTALPFLPRLHSLKQLEISHCPLLQSLTKGRLSASLDTLLIDDCPLLRVSCSKGGEDWHKIEKVPNIWIDLEDAHSMNEDGDGADN